MVAVEKVGKAKVRSRAQKQFLRSATTVGLMLAVLATAILATYLVTEPVLHPTHHPRIIKFCTYMAHFHPRLCHALLLATIGVTGMAPFLALVLPHYMNIRMRLKRSLPRPALKNVSQLNQPIPLTLPLLLPQAWAALGEAFPGMTVRSADMRGTHWELLRKDEVRRDMVIALRYTHDPLAIKCWRLYPRQITCAIKLRAKGVSTIAELTYSAGSAMDYRTVYDIIEQTNRAVLALKVPADHPAETAASPVLAA